MQFAKIKIPLIGFMFCALIFSNSLWAANPNEEEVDIDIQSSIGLVFGLGLGGAILGLSTLSFLDYPERNLDRISRGGAVGIIIGVLLSVYQNSEKTLGKGAPPSRASLDFYPGRLNWGRPWLELGAAGGSSNLLNLENKNLANSANLLQQLAGGWQLSFEL